MPKPAIERIEKRFGGFRDHRAGRENRLGAGGFQRLIILRRHDAADHHHNVRAAVLFQFALELRHERQMSAGERGNAEDVHIILDRLACGLRRRRKQRPDIDIEADIRKGRRDYFLAAVMAVLTDLGDEDARPAAFIFFKLGDALLHALDSVRHADLPPVNARDRLDLGLMAAKDLFQRRRNLADRGLGARGVNG